MVLNDLNRSDKYLRHLSFPHWLIMGRSQNWPDLRSPITNPRYTSCRYLLGGIPNPESFKSFSQPLWPCRDWKAFFSEVGSLDMAWWPDAWWPGPRIFRKVTEQLSKHYVSRIKPQGGGVQTPPSWARVNSISRHTWFEITSLFLFSYFYFLFSKHNQRSLSACIWGR